MEPAALLAPVGQVPSLLRLRKNISVQRLAPSRAFSQHRPP